MGPSEFVDSGRFPGGRSNFSQTCSLLSQYLKEKGSFGELTLGLTHCSESKGAPTETMNLLSMIEKSSQDPNSRNPNPPAAAVFQQQIGGRDEAQNKSDISGVETAPMTIFYGGHVVVFNDFPADKAKEIMMLATKSGAAHSHPNAAIAPPRSAQSPAESTTYIPNIAPPHSDRPSLASDLPIARKNSLARFLEKRRDRITANAPYPASKQAAAPPPRAVKTEAWLGLAAPQLIQRR